jgi:hypothetical protein
MIEKREKTKPENERNDEAGDTHAAITGRCDWPPPCPILPGPAIP